jgi:hypothetical protein
MLGIILLILEKLYKSSNLNIKNSYSRFKFEPVQRTEEREKIIEISLQKNFLEKDNLIYYHFIEKYNIFKYKIKNMSKFSDIIFD